MKVSRGSAGSWAWLALERVSVLFVSEPQWYLATKSRFLHAGRSEEENIRLSLSCLQALTSYRRKTQLCSSLQLLVLEMSAFYLTKGGRSLAGVV